MTLCIFWNSSSWRVRLVHSWYLRYTSHVIINYNNNNNNNKSICKAHIVSIRAESEAPVIR